jgi:hypothetical protein
MPGHEQRVTRCECSERSAWPARFEQSVPLGRRRRVEQHFAQTGPIRRASRERASSFASGSQGTARTIWRVRTE